MSVFCLAKRQGTEKEAYFKTTRIMFSQLESSGQFHVVKYSSQRGRERERSVWKWIQEPAVNQLLNGQWPSKIEINQSNSSRGPPENLSGAAAVSESTHNVCFGTDSYLVVGIG